MSGSCFGTAFRIMTWGESHGKAVGVVVDGCPSCVPLSEDDISSMLSRRRPGQSSYSTKRNESDTAEILSGVFEGHTTGTPISIMIRNQDARSNDYDEIKNIFRPSHADFTYDAKYGNRDYRGGGRASGRETAGRVMAGAVAAKVLARKGITVSAYVTSIGGIEADIERYDMAEAFNNPLCMPDKIAAEKAAEYLDKLIEAGDSCGGVVECVIEGIPVGVGEPVFGKLDAEIAKAVMSIGAVKGIEFGSGFASAKSTGSRNNDAFFMDKGRVVKATNNSGGILGGISDGSPVVFRAAFKPTPSISIPQKTVSRDGENTEIVIKGRHDPVIAPRAAVVVEAMASIAVLDLLLLCIGREAFK